MKKINILLLLLFGAVGLHAQIGLESYLQDNGTYLRLRSSSSIFYSSMVFGINSINTTDPLSGPNVLKLQSTGLGNVTIGATDIDGTNTTDPRLTIRASDDANMDIRLEGHGRISSQGSIVMHLDDNDNAIESFQVQPSGAFPLTLMKISEDANHFILGNLAVGNGITHATEYSLSVHGKAIAEEVRVELVSNWPDYVFKDDYQLISLNKLEKEIETLGHLPGMPAAEKVEEEGFDLGEMNRLLVEKVEELTLHVIELNKRLQMLENTKN